MRKLNFSQDEVIRILIEKLVEQKRIDFVPKEATAKLFVHKSSLSASDHNFQLMLSPDVSASEE